MDFRKNRKKWSTLVPDHFCVWNMENIFDKDSHEIHTGEKKVYFCKECGEVPIRSQFGGASEDTLRIEAIQMS